MGAGRYGGLAQTGWVNGNGRYQAPPPRGWGNYQYPSVSNNEDSYSESSYSDFETRPPTNASQESFNMDPSSYVQGQRQAAQQSQRGRTPTPQRGPSGQAQFPNHTRSSPGHYGPQMQIFPSMQSLSSQSSRDDLLGAMDSPFLDPSSATQPRETNRKTSPTPARKPLPPSEPAAWYCDVCTEGKSATQARFHCTVCHDYDLCVQCHMEEYTSKDHRTSHKLLSISMKHTVQVDAITPCHDNVTPQFSPPRTQENWTEEGENRWLHLRNSPSHARFIVRRLSRGAYLMHLVIKFKFSDHVDMDTFKRAKEIGFGKLKIATGSPLKTSMFLNEQRTEDATLPQQLFGFDRSTNFELTIPDNVTNPMQPWVLAFDTSSTTTYIGMESGVNPSNAILGILLQWSEVVEFQANDNPILIMTLNEIMYVLNAFPSVWQNTYAACRMDELLEYDEPPPPPPPLPNPKAAAAPPTRPQATVAEKTTAADADDDDGVTLQEIADAAQLLEENGHPITSDNLLKIIAATRKVKTEIQTALLLRQMQQIRERQRREQELRQRRAQQQAQAAGELLLLSWLLSD
jgi:hypothetical protein